MGYSYGRLLPVLLIGAAGLILSGMQQREGMGIQNSELRIENSELTLRTGAGDQISTAKPSPKVNVEFQISDRGKGRTETIRGVEARKVSSELRIEKGEIGVESSGFRAGAHVSQQSPDTVNVTPGSTLFLEPNSPNPFYSTGGTTIAFTLDRDATVTLSIYDAFYNLVEVLIDEEERTEGRHPILYAPGQRLASGMYFYTLKVNDGERLTGRMLYLR